MYEEAIILLGHGSRVPGAAEAMEKIAGRLKEKYNHPRVEVCFMSRLGPHFKEVFEEVVQEGAGTIIVIPYFLNSGLHIKLDIPEMMQGMAARFPYVKLIFGKSIGYDESLVDIVERRIKESRKLRDVKELILEPKEAYPLPDGQCEYVAIPRKMAAEWEKFIEGQVKEDRDRR